MIKNCLIVLNYRDFQTTVKFIEMAEKFKDVDKIIVVDNNSNDGSYEKLIEYKNIKVDVIKTKKNGGYSYGNNYGIKYAINKYTPKYIVVSNPDVVLNENTILEMMNIYEKYENVGIIAPTMKERNKSVRSYWKLPTLIDDLIESSLILKKILQNRRYSNNMSRDYNTPCLIDNNIKFVDVLPGCFFMIESETIKKIDYLDEDVFLYCEERILTHKLKEIGYRNILITNLEYIHDHSTSINKSIKSVKKQFDILYDSRLTYHIKYNELSGIKLMFTKFIFNLGRVEKSIIYMVKDIIIKSKK